MGKKVVNILASLQSDFKNVQVSQIFKKPIPCDKRDKKRDKKKKDKKKHKKHKKNRRSSDLESAVTERKEVRRLDGCLPGLRHFNLTIEIFRWLKPKMLVRVVGRLSRAA